MRLRMPRRFIECDVSAVVGLWAGGEPRVPGLFCNQCTRFGPDPKNLIPVTSPLFTDLILSLTPRLPESIFESRAVR